MTQTPLVRAIAVAGSGVALAKAVGVTPMAVSHWKSRGVPAHQVLAIELATGVSRYELRPDIYPEQSSSMSTNVPPKQLLGQSIEDAVDLYSTGGAQ